MGEFPTFDPEAPYFAGRAAMPAAAGPCPTQYGRGIGTSIVVPGNRLKPNLTLATARLIAVAHG